MPKKFSINEKEEIRKKLIASCRSSWMNHQKSSVEKMCRYACISKGAFYIFFETKEDVFYEVLREMQEQIHRKMIRILSGKPDREGVLEVLHFLYREFDENQFIHNGADRDWAVLMERLKKERRDHLEQLADANLKLLLHAPGLELAISEDQATAVLYTLLMGLKQKETLPEHEMAFAFLAELAVAGIYKEI